MLRRRWSLIKASCWVLVVALLSGCGAKEDASSDVAANGGTDGSGAAFSCDDFESPIPAESRSQLEMPPADLRNYRYCEVLPVFPHGDGFCVEVYNTLSFSDCPEAQWYALDAKTLGPELGAKDVFLNGPRHWVINGAKGSADMNPMNLKISSFGGLQMGRPGLLALSSLSDMPSQGVRYVEHEVIRSNTWIFAAGNEVYELTSPSGAVYIMQSYSRIVDPKLSVDDLSGLGSRLTLPQGWTFSTRVLEADYELVADGKAVVIQDDLANTYQRR